MRRALLLPLLLAAACFQRSAVPDAERERASRGLEGAQRFLAVAVNVGPFFGDATKLLASDGPVDEVELLESPGGQVITPPPAQRVLPPGTPVRITQVEFPTGWIYAKRVVMTPRDRPWVYLEVAGVGKPVVLVLSPQLATSDEVRGELDRWLTTIDPTPTLQGWPREHQLAVVNKRLTEDLAPRAVEMAWGYPERKVIDRPAATEEWSWSNGRRRAWFADGRLRRWQPR